MNPLHPDRMSASERLAEAAAILALGLIRLRSRQSSRLSGEPENSSVDFNAYQSSHAANLNSTENGA